MLSSDKRVAEIIQRVNENPALAALLEGIGHELQFEANASAVLSGDYSSSAGYGEKEVIFMAGRYYGYLEAKQKTGRGKHPVDDICSKTDIFDVDAVLDFLMEAAGAGAISRIRQCDVCKKWMFAGRKDQNFCSAVCRHKQYEQSPHAKERRNAYMRFRYAVNPGESHEWRDSQIPMSKRPTFEQWLKHKEPTPREWQAVLERTKGRK